ncbi:MAG: FeoA family protein [Anaerolineales bacterium]|nr:FeoA family protein [Anaerolineales bacterium]
MPNPLRSHINSGMNLLQVPMNMQVKIILVEDVPALIAKLNQYGLYQGDTLSVVRAAPLGGPLLIQVNGRELAIGRDVAAKIIVEIA